MESMHTFVPAKVRLAAAATVAIMSSCATATSSTSGQTGRGYIRFEVDPPNAEVVIDDRYSGQADGWRGGVVPVKPGDHRVTIRAAGYISQRFDIDVRHNEEVSIVLALEPVLDVTSERTERKRILR